MEMVPLIFMCEMERDALLPEFKGSAIRGALGKALRQTACAMKRYKCTSCLLSRQCIYASFFESMPGSRTPHPFVLEPPMISKREFKAGETFYFKILLFGDVLSHIPYLVFSVIQMGKAGIGKGIKEGYGRFRLISVLGGNEIIFDENSEQLKHSASTLNLELKAFQDEVAEAITVTFVTPLRLKHGNSFTDQPDFHILIRACLRRIALLEEAFGKGEPLLDYHDLVERAGHIEIAEQDCTWRDITRFSSRQKTRMKIGGITGTVSYRGRLDDFISLLKYCEIVHIGKQTSFGLGKIRIDLEI